MNIQATNSMKACESDSYDGGGRKSSLPPGNAWKSNIRAINFRPPWRRGSKTVPASGESTQKRYNKALLQFLDEGGRNRPCLRETANSTPIQTRLAFEFLQGEGQGSDQSRPDPDETHVGDPQHCTGPLGLKGCLKFDDLSSHPSGNFKSSCAQLPS